MTASTRRECSSCALLRLLPVLALFSSRATLAQEVAQPVPCLRWAHQSTVAQNEGGDGHSIWIYGGRARTSIGQALNTWTNALITLDLSAPFSIGDPPLEVIQSDRNSSDAPPPVALGALASSGDGSTLYQYFGQFSDTPPVEPTPNRLWQYSIPERRWSIVNYTGDANIQRVAEGAAALVPDLGTNGEPKAFYFGGHQDTFTVQNWDSDRVFLSSMTELDLGSHEWKNISTFSKSGDSGSRNSTSSDIPPILRADSTLTYVPNLGTDNKGVLVAIGVSHSSVLQETTCDSCTVQDASHHGGNENQMIENTVLDVYDIGAGAFVKQATQGDIMRPRVNHCAVRGSAIVNGQEQHQIFVYGGHASNRTTQIQEGQDTDLYVLSIPSYTWTFVGNNLTSQPVARAGHTCELVGDTMIVIGGYISEDYLCEQPGIYLLNTTSLSWSTDFVPGMNYQTPQLLRGLIGGSGTSNSTGGSGWTSPNNNYTATVTQGGAVPTSSPDPDDGDLQDGGGGSRLGAILGGVVGGLCLLFFILFLVKYFAKRQRKRERAIWSRRLRQDRYAWTANDDEEEGSAMVAMPYSDMGRSSTGHDGPQRPSLSTPMYASDNSRDSRGAWSTSKQSASDNVESDTEGMHVTGLSHLAPRETLRVTNPSNRSTSALSYSTTQKST